MSLRLTAVSFEQACQFVAMWHRHHEPPRGHKFSVGVADDTGVLHGVVMVGRPVARHFDNGSTLEVNRTATDGTPNANSMLYGAAWRAAKALGYARLITYTVPSEGGASLRAAGWRILAERPPQTWDPTVAPPRRAARCWNATNAMGGVMTPWELRTGDVVPRRRAPEVLLRLRP